MVSNRVVFTILLSLIAYVSMAATPLDNGTPSIRVVGATKQNIPPDTLELELQVQVRSQDLATAMKEIEIRQQKLLKYLDAFGLPKECVRLRSLSSMQMYGEKGMIKEVAYYELTQDILVVLKEITKFSYFQSGLLNLGVATIQQINAVSSQEEQIKQQLLLKALSVARTKASALANSEGMQLGSVLTIAEGTYEPMAYAYSGAALGGIAGGANNISVQDIEVSAEVTVVYELKRQ